MYDALHFTAKCIDIRCVQVVTGYMLDAVYILVIEIII